MRRSYARRYKRIVTQYASTSTPAVTPATLPLVQLTLSVPRQSGNALLSAVEEIRTVVGTRLERPAEYAREESLTHAALALGALSAQLRRNGCTLDANYAR